MVLSPALRDTNGFGPTPQEFDELADEVPSMTFPPASVKPRRPGEGHRQRTMRRGLGGVGVAGRRVVGLGERPCSYGPMGKNSVWFRAV